MDIYASPEDLASWIPAGTSSDVITRNLRYASIAVARACNRNLYSGDTSFPPPLVDATCAQVGSWVSLGIDPSKLGLDQAPVKKSSILGGDVERDTTGLLAAFQEAVTCLCQAATDILLQANLLWQPVPLFDDSGCLPSWGQDRPGMFPGLFAAETDWPFV
ncbi:hypothetical protein [Jatrophihabitans sp.]|uniref:hypothetical protein n=1 Tax=Jatrophihabitans sp. TaxID=1932789 RepID=UPI0030C6AC08|nr:hypothetical protein [Jatrophihabitans sp.]